MKSLATLPLLLLAVLAATPDRPSPAAERPARPNALLVTADDLGLQLSCYSETAIETPHIDALAQRSTLFETAYVTQASCSPSRSSMFTGLYPHANGQYGLLNAGAGFELQPFYPRRAIRDRRYKLIHNLLAGKAKPSTGIDSDTAYAQSRRPEYDGTDVRWAFDTFADPPEYELYDLEADPWEFRNLAGVARDPAHAERLAELKQALLDWRREAGDPLLDPQGFEKIARQGARAR